MACSLYCLMTETDISKLTRFDKDTFLNAEIKLNSKRTTFEKVLESKSLLSAILDKIIDYVSTKEPNILHHSISMIFKPVKDDDLEVTVVIPEKYKDFYEIKFIGDILYIYDRFEKLTLTISPNMRKARDLY